MDKALEIVLVEDNADDQEFYISRIERATINNG